MGMYGGVESSWFDLYDFRGLSNVDDPIRTVLSCGRVIPTWLIWMSFFSSYWSLAVWMSVLKLTLSCLKFTGTQGEWYDNSGVRLSPSYWLNLMIG